MLDLTVIEPPAVAGETLAIDQVRQSVNMGHRSTEESLQFHYRSTQGSRQNLSFCQDAIVTEVAVDGKSVAIRPENGELALAVLPGEHNVEINWRSNTGDRFAARPGSVDLHAAASNVETSLTLSSDRWPLFALGQGVGPAFLYWGELLTFVILAIVLGRLAGSPLSTPEWLLLGLGLSTISWTVLLLVAVWLFVMRWRERSSDAQTLPPRRFNAVQVALAVLTVWSVLCPKLRSPAAWRYGLLATPGYGRHRPRLRSRHIQLVCGQIGHNPAPTYGLQRADVGLSGSHIRVGIVDCARAGALVTFRLASVEHRRLLEGERSRQGFRSAAGRTIIPRNSRDTN